MTLQQWKHVFRRAGNDVRRNHSFAFANGLSYQFPMSLFPALIALAAIVGYLPIPHLFRSGKVLLKAERRKTLRTLRARKAA